MRSTIAAAPGTGFAASIRLKKPGDMRMAASMTGHPPRPVHADCRAAPDGLPPTAPAAVLHHLCSAPPFAARRALHSNSSSDNAIDAICVNRPRAARHGGVPARHALRSNAARPDRGCIPAGSPASVAAGGLNGACSGLPRHGSPGRRAGACVQAAPPEARLFMRLPAGAPVPASRAPFRSRRFRRRRSRACVRVRACAGWWRGRCRPCGAGRVCGRLR